MLCRERRVDRPHYGLTAGGVLGDAPLAFESTDELLRDVTNAAPGGDAEPVGKHRRDVGEVVMVDPVPHRQDHL